MLCLSSSLVLGISPRMPCILGRLVHHRLFTQTSFFFLFNFDRGFSLRCAGLPWTSILLLHPPEHCYWRSMPPSLPFCFSLPPGICLSLTDFLGRWANFSLEIGLSPFDWERQPTVLYSCVPRQPLCWRLSIAPMGGTWWGAMRLEPIPGLSLWPQCWLANSPLW